MSGRAIAYVSVGTVGALWLALCFTISNPVHRIVAIAGGLACGGAGFVFAGAWRKPMPQKMKDAVEELQGDMIDSAKNGLKQQLLQPAPWTLNAIDIESSTVTNTVSEPLINPEQFTHSPVSEPVSEVSESHSLFNFDIDPNPWESNHSLTDEQEPARY